MKTIITFIFILLLNFINAQTVFFQDSITLKADSLQSKGKYKDALVLREKALANYSSASLDYKNHLQAKYHYTKSCIYEFDSYRYRSTTSPISKKEREAKLQMAIDESMIAKKLIADSKERNKVFRYWIQNRLYHEHGWKGEWKKALSEAMAGYNILKDTLTEKDKLLIDLIYDIGYVNGKIGDFTESVKWFEHTLRLNELYLKKDAYSIALAHNDLAKQYKNIGLRKKEKDILIRAERILDTITTNPRAKIQLFDCYNNLFNWYAYYGDKEKARLYLDKKDSVYRKEVNNKAYIIKNKEDYLKETLSLYKAKLIYTKKFDNSKDIEHIIDNIVNTTYKDNKIEGVELEFICRALLEKAELVKVSNPNSAINYQNEALEILEQYKEISDIDKGIYFVKKIELLIYLNRFNDAISFLEKFISKGISLKSPSLFNLYILQGKCLSYVNKFEDANMAFNMALKLISKNLESTINDINFSDLNPFYTFKTAKGFLEIGDSYVNRFHQSDQEKYIELAFHYYEIAAKIHNEVYLGNYYNEELSNSQNAIASRLLNCAYLIRKDTYTKSAISQIVSINSKLVWNEFVYKNQKSNLNISDSLLLEEDELKSKLNFYQLKLITEIDEDDKVKKLWKNKIVALKKSIEQFYLHLRITHDKYLKFSDTVFDINSYQVRLNDDDIALMYKFLDGNLYRIEIRKESIIITKKTNTTELKKQISDFIISLKSNNENFNDLQFSVKRILLPEVDYKLINNMTIIPDDLLFYLPFETLFQIDDMPNIHYNSSLLMDYESNHYSRKNEGPISVGVFSTNKDLSYIDESGSRIHYSALKSTNEESEAIFRAFRGSQYVNSPKDVFLNNSNHHDIFHFATHSFVDKSNPDRSALAFNSDKNNGFLYASELYNHTINAELAVLSACETGVGQLYAGEGIMSLSRAFTYAGTKSTIMSLWKVPDKQTAILMGSFYYHLKQGKAKNIALKKAKQDYLRNTEDPNLKHPYYWAGFVLTGDTSPIILDNDNNWWLYIIGVSIILMLLFFWNEKHLKTN